MLSIAAVPSKAKVVIALIQKPKKPIYAKKAPEYIAVLGPADKPVNKTIALIMTIHGVLTNINSRESSTERIP